MANQIFYVSKQKNAILYRTLVITNILCTVLMVYLANRYSFKDFVQERVDVLQSYLGIHKFKKYNNLNDFRSFSDFITNAVIVY